MAIYDITKLANGYTFPETNTYMYPIATQKIDDTHFIAFYSASNSNPESDIKVKMFSFDKSTGAVTLIGSTLTLTNFYGVNGIQTSMVDSNHVLAVGSQVAYAKGGAVIIEINLSTWAMSQPASIFEWETDVRGTVNMVKFDDTHYVLTYQRTTSSLGYAKTIFVNTSTWAVSTLFTTATYFVTSYTNVVGTKLDATHFITCAESGGSDGYAFLFEVDLSTWAVTFISSYEYDTTMSRGKSLWKLDDTHIIVFWDRGTSSTNYARVLVVDFGAGTISAAGSQLTVSGSSSGPRCSQVDDNHFINVWFNRYTGYVVDIFEVNLSTWAITKMAKQITYSVDTTNTSGITTIERIDYNNFIVFYRDEIPAPDVMYLSSLYVELPLLGSSKFFQLF